jgi:hypothetical protein
VYILDVEPDIIDTNEPVQEVFNSSDNNTLKVTDSSVAITIESDVLHTTSNNNNDNDDNNHQNRSDVNPSTSLDPSNFLSAKRGRRHPRASTNKGESTSGRGSGRGRGGRGSRGGRGGRGGSSSSSSRGGRGSYRGSYHSRSISQSNRDNNNNTTAAPAPATATTTTATVTTSPQTNHELDDRPVTSRGGGKRGHHHHHHPRGSFRGGKRDGGGGNNNNNSNNHTNSHPSRTHRVAAPNNCTS